MSDDFLHSLLQLAKSGDRLALGKLLQWYRAWLKTLAESRLGPHLAVRCDPSDVAQFTCLSVVKNINRFRGDTPAEFAGWIRMIHERKIQNTIRDHVHAECRATGREVPAAIESRAAPMSFSPSQRAMQGESIVEITQALQRLPERQRRAVQFRHLDGWSIADIANFLETTDAAIGGLLKRGLQQLREEMQKNTVDPSTRMSD